MSHWRLGLVYLVSILQMVPAKPTVRPLSGPFLLVPKQVADCANKGTDELRLVSSKLSKIGRDTYSYTSDVLLPYGLSDEISFGIRCASYGNGGWKENAFNFHFGQICTIVKAVFPEIYELIKIHGNVQDCPVPPGNYTVRNAIYKPTSLKAFPNAYYNKYRTDIYFQMKGKRIGCKRIFFDAIPRKTG